MIFDNKSQLILKDWIVDMIDGGTTEDKLLQLLRDAANGLECARMVIGKLAGVALIAAIRAPTKKLRLEAQYISFDISQHFEFSMDQENNTFKLTPKNMDAANDSVN